MTAPTPEQPAEAAEIAARTEAILAGDDTGVEAPIRIAAALAARGIEAHVTIRHTDTGHRITLELPTDAVGELANRVEASDLGLALRRASAAVTAGAASQRAGAALRAMAAQSGAAPSVPELSPEELSALADVITELALDDDDAADGDREQLLTAEQLDALYRERSQLLALLATEFPAAIYPAPDVEELGWWVLYLSIAGRWLGWHISPADRPLFSAVPSGTDGAGLYDGHTTAEKYAYIADYVAQRELTVTGQQVHRAAVATALALVRNLEALTPEQMMDPDNGFAMKMIVNAVSGAESATNAFAMPSRFPGTDLPAQIAPGQLRLGRSLIAEAYRAAASHATHECPHGPQDGPSDAHQATADA